MEKIAVVYWSQTGNTKVMAETIAAAVKSGGADAEVFQVSKITPEQAAGYDKLALGCPAMGAEVLEEGEFEPFFTELEGSLGKKKVALFGSYGWGDGQWMRDWQDRAVAAGAQLFRGEGLIVNEIPQDADLENCKEFGKEFAEY